MPGAQTVDEDTILPFAGVSVADVDGSALATTLNVSSGTLNVTAGAGVTGNGSASVTITGTAVQINAALAASPTTGNLDFNGGDTLTVATSDGTAIGTDSDRHHCQSSERRARARRCGRHLAGGCTGIAFAISQPHRRG